MTTVIIFFLGFALAIVLAQKLKVNAGFLAIILGFILTWTMAGEGSMSFIRNFPVTLFWNYGMPIIFYAFATANGTMTVMGKKIAYQFKGAKWAMSVAMMLANALVAACGAGTNSTFIVAPLAWGLCLQCGVNPFMIPVSLWAGSFIGAFLPWTSTGALNYSLYEQFLSSDAGSVAFRVSIYYALLGLFTYIVVFLLFKGWKLDKVADGSAEIEKPEPFNKSQKITLATIFVCIALLLVPSIISQFAANPVTDWMKTNLTMSVTTAAGISVLAILRAGELKDVFGKFVNWNILWTITGMAMYCTLASTLGVVDTLGDVMANMSGSMVIATMCLISAALSFVTSASTVQPLLMSLIPTLAITAGTGEIPIVVAMMVGVGVTSISPFSTGGAAILIGAPPEIAPKMINKQLIAAIALAIVATLAGLVGLYNF